VAEERRHEGQCSAAGDGRANRGAPLPAKNSGTCVSPPSSDCVHAVGQVSWRGDGVQIEGRDLEARVAGSVRDGQQTSLLASVFL